MNPTPETPTTTQSKCPVCKSEVMILGNYYKCATCNSQSPIEWLTNPPEWVTKMSTAEPQTLTMTNADGQTPAQVHAAADKAAAQKENERLEAIIDVACTYPPVEPADKLTLRSLCNTYEATKLLSEMARIYQDRSDYAAERGDYVLASRYKAIATELQASLHRIAIADSTGR